MTEVSDHVLDRIYSAVLETVRLRDLSNEQLCREFIKLDARGSDTELHTNEMLSRLWPEWSAEKRSYEPSFNRQDK